MRDPESPLREIEKYKVSKNYFVKEGCGESIARKGTSTMPLMPKRP